MQIFYMKHISLSLILGLIAFCSKWVISAYFDPDVYPGVNLKLDNQGDLICSHRMLTAHRLPDFIDTIGQVLSHTKYKLGHR